MIDISKMKALATRLREDYEFSISITSMRYQDAVPRTPVEAADAIDSLLSELEAAAAFQQAVLDPENQPSQHGTILLDMHKKEVTRLRAELEAREADRRRLDFLDRMNGALNKHYGTKYGWKLILSPNIVRLMSGRHHAGFVGDIDLNDANSGLSSFDSCRKAIDEVLAQRQGEDHG
ncbi:hypothetical protein LGM54_06190 [Burkholderia cenocepacia]|uniref:hypothetical protein n=1 Tax=Burkholderia cenocepacia TaxID=95486 RepID=UPI001CF4350A|nr:hypothetical protein [Burkholderia cenocepacia]MCA7962542.1 hypothetical protein [Burkholderia cenocepacia]